MYCSLNFKTLINLSFESGDRSHCSILRPRWLSVSATSATEPYTVPSNTISTDASWASSPSPSSSSLHASGQKTSLDFESWGPWAGYRYFTSTITVTSTRRLDLSTSSPRTGSFVDSITACTQIAVNFWLKGQQTRCCFGRGCLCSGLGCDASDGLTCLRCVPRYSSKRSWLGLGYYSEIRLREHC